MRHLVRFRPAFDDLVNGCAHETKGDHGRGSVQCALVSLGGFAAASLEFSTGWRLPETYEHGRDIYGRVVDWRELPGPDSGVVFLHSRYWMPDTEVYESKNCEYVGGRCFSDVGFTMSDVGIDKLLREGSDSVFEWLDEIVDDIRSRQVKAEVMP